MVRPAVLLLLAAVAPCALTACDARDASPEAPLIHARTGALLDEGLRPFYHGVASGDPLPDRVVIWTRVTPAVEGPVEVRWSVAADGAFSDIVRSGETTTGPARDYTVKVDVDGLAPDTRYYYRFVTGTGESIVGRTKTSPLEEDVPLRFAVVSCSHYETGYFNAYDRIADRTDLDAVIHLGDYIYEYAPGDTSLGRKHVPASEIVDLADYRTRYAQYRLDPDLRRVHQQHPFVAIWDDHEIANNAHRTGAQNHQPESEGAYERRRESARQAYFEWLPVRESADGSLYRALSFGPQADLFMLDERLAGRSPQVDSLLDPAFESEARSMLGAGQLDWLTGALAGSTARWKIIGNQVLFADVDFSRIRPDRSRNLDAWDGYPAEKRRILKALAEHEVTSTIMLTGDTHSSWAFEVFSDLKAYRADPARATVAVEFGTPSVTSTNLDERMPADSVRALEGRLVGTAENPHLKYADMRNHGYVLLTLTAERALAEWYYVDTIRSISNTEFRAAAWATPPVTLSLKAVDDAL